MNELMAIVQIVIEKGPGIVAAVVGVLSALIALFMLIPGEQPEKALQAVVNLLAKFSKK
jgi:hypothetical protein